MVYHIMEKDIFGHAVPFTGVVSFQKPVLPLNFCISLLYQTSNLRIEFSAELGNIGVRRNKICTRSKFSRVSLKNLNSHAFQATTKPLGSVLKDDVSQRMFSKEFSNETYCVAGKYYS